MAVMFWSDDAEKTDRTRVAAYLAREASKASQKLPPPGFAHVGRYYGVLGRTAGFVPIRNELELERLVALELESRLNRWVAWKLHVQRRGAPARSRLFARRRWDGITAFGLGPTDATRILMWSERAALKMRQRHAARQGSGGAATGEITKSA